MTFRPALRACAIAAAFLISVSCDRAAPSPSAGTAPAGITAKADPSGQDILALATELASAGYAGRLAGSAGGRAAAELLAGRLRDAGYEVRFQEFPLRVAVNDGPVRLEAVMPDGVVRTFAYREDFREVVRGGWMGGEAEGPSFVADSVDGSFPRGAVVLLPARLYSPEVVRVFADGGAAGLVVELPAGSPAQRPLYAGQDPGRLVEPLEGPVVLAVSTPAFGELVTLAASSVRLRVASPVRFADATGRNIVATRDGDGGGPRPRFVLMAHYDHVGADPDGSWFPGALDNASGTASVVELAEALAAAAPGADLAVVLTDGEEAGLYGAQALAREPPFPLRGLDVVNMDMAGSRADLELAVYSNGDDAGLELARRVVDALRAAGFRASSQYPVVNVDHSPLTYAGAAGVTICEYDESAYHTKADVPADLDADELDRLADGLFGFLVTMLAGP